MKQYILLDWDGNIAKTLELWLEATHDMLNSRKITKTDQEIIEGFGHFHTAFMSWGVSDLDTATTQIDSYVKKRLPDVELYPDAIPVIEALHAQGKKLALISTSSRHLIEHLLDKYRLSDYFDALVSGDDVTHYKPHPEPLYKGLELLGGSAEQAIMIGDSDNDIRAGTNAHVDTILFYPDTHQKFYSLEKLQSLHPTHIVDDFRQILDLV